MKKKYIIRYNDYKNSYEIVNSILDNTPWEVIVEFKDKDDAERLCHHLNYMTTYQEELISILKGINTYIYRYEEFYDFYKNDPRPLNHTIKHLSFVDMKNETNSHVLGILNQLKSFKFCPECRCGDKYTFDFYYDDDYIYTEEDCGNCGYNWKDKRPVNKYDSKKWER